MGLFTRARSPESSDAARRASAPLGSGRRLRSALSPGECAGVLEQVFSGYRQRQYPELPHLVPSGIQWTAAEGRPSRAVSGSDESSDFLLFTFADADGGTEAGIFPLGSGDARLTLSVVGHWQQRDSSLSSTGKWAPGTVRLTPPPIGDQLIDGTLSAAGYPLTPANRASLASQFFQMFLVKCYQFVQSQSGEATAKRFVDSQQRAADPATLTGPLRSALQSLAEGHPGVLPYIQDLPLRCRAILLEAAGSAGEGTVWSGMERSG